MLSSIYRLSLLITLVSSLTKAFYQNTPWPHAADHPSFSPETTARSDFHRSPSLPTPVGAPPRSVSFGSPLLTAPVPILSLLASAHTSSSTVPSSRRLRHHDSSHLAPSIPVYYLRPHTDEISSVIPPHAAPTTSPWSTGDVRPILQCRASLHGRTGPSSNGGIQQNGPMARAPARHPTHTHTCGGASFSRLAVLPATAYGIPPQKIQISNLSAHLVHANLLWAPLPPLDLQNTPCSSTFTALPHPPTALSPALNKSSSSTSQDIFLSYSRFHRCTNSTSLTCDDGWLCSSYGWPRHHRTIDLTSLHLTKQSITTLPSINTMVSLAAASGLASATTNSVSPKLGLGLVRLSPGQKSQNILSALISQRENKGIIRSIFQQRN